MKNKQDKLLDALAEFIHHQFFIVNMKYLLSKSCLIRQPATIELNIPIDIWDKWMKETKYEYSDLPEQEKEAVRKEAQKILKIIEKNSLQKK